MWGLISHGHTFYELIVLVIAGKLTLGSALGAVAGVLAGGYSSWPPVAVFFSVFGGVALGLFISNEITSRRAQRQLKQLSEAQQTAEGKLAPTSFSFDSYRCMFSKLMRVDVNGLWIEHAPYIDFIVHVRQTSDWTVTLDDVQGRTRIGGIETNLPPRLVKSPIKLDSPRGWYNCTIRQHLPQSLAIELISHPGDLNLWSDDAKVTFSLAGLKWIGSVSTPQGDIDLPERVVLDNSFTILGPVREKDGDKVLWVTEPIVVSQVWRQQSTGGLRESTNGAASAPQSEAGKEKSPRQSEP